jgi:hypothetical protein
VSQESVELAKRAMATYNTDAALRDYDALVTPDFEWIGRISRLRSFLDLDEAMRAAGLED